jgi:signal transduction histidine kinase
MMRLRIMPLNSRRALGLGTAVCGTILSAVLLWIVYTRNPHYGLPYGDSFAGSEADEWKSFGGTWATIDGSMRNDSDERGAKLITGSPHWKDYVLDADVKLLGQDGDAGVVIRSSDEESGVDSYRGYYAGLRTRDNRLILGRADHGWFEFRNTPVLGKVEAFRWYHLRVLALGCEIVVAVTSPSNPGAPRIMAVRDRDCIRSGRIGLRSYSAGGAWKNVRVRVATTADEPAIRQGWPIDNVRDRPVVADSFSLFGSGSLPSPAEPQKPLAVAQVQPISSLRTVAASHSATATVRGVVSLTSPVIYVQDSTGGVAVQPSSSQPLKTGDEVQVSGIAQPGPYSSSIAQATIQLLWARTPLQPLSVTASQAATGSFAATLVEVEGFLRGKEKGPGNDINLNLESGQQSFRAVIQGGRGDSAFRRLKPNSLLRLRGVCVVDPQYTHNILPFVMLLQSLDDIETVAGPPWWSTRNLVAGGFALLLLLLIGLFVFSRIERWRLRAVLEERELLAHEMHDTLAQSFAGLGFQLQAVRNRLPENMSSLREQLDLACDLVRHSHQEARRNIALLRSDSIAQLGLTGALEHCAEGLLHSGGITLTVTTLGDPHPLPLRISGTLLRVGQEALANSIRHGAPSSIAITVSYTDEVVRVTIEDDGVGFEEGYDQKGFGLRGMRRRAAAISADIEITSSPGKGARVILTTPLPSRLPLNAIPGLVWKRISGLHSHEQV